MSNCGDNASFTPAPECVFPEGTLEITENGIFDVTEYASADVNVSGGGSSYTLLAEDDFEVLNPSSSGVGDVVKTFQIGSAAWTASKIIYVRIRIKGEYEKPHFVETDSFSINRNVANGTTTPMNFSNKMLIKLADDTWYGADSSAGFVYSANISSDGIVTINARGHSTYGVNGTYHAEVYALDWPDDISPFA